jgi:hypothetical protein
MRVSMHKYGLFRFTGTYSGERGEAAVLNAIARVETIGRRERPDA